MRMIFQIPKVPFLVLFLMIAVFLVPAQANKPAGGAATCSTETTQDGASNDDDDGIFCQVIVAPGNLNLKNIAGPSLLAVCHTLQPNTPLACGNSAGSAAGFGGAIYDADALTSGNHQLTAWVKQSAGLCGVQGIGCGFDIVLCNDVDLNGGCTESGSDQFLHSQSNEAIVGGGYLIPAIGDLPCVPTITCAGTTLPTIGGDCSDTDKDVKNCGADDDAMASFCAKPAEEDINVDDWNDGQVITYIGSWIGTWIGWLDLYGYPTNIGAGFSVGTFDAWLLVGNSCTLPECDNDVDDDGNGATDFPYDPGCGNPFDNNEASLGGEASECNDGISNEAAYGEDDDGLADDEDPDCYDFTGPGGTPVYDPTNEEDTDDTNVSLPECADGQDNDGNVFTDYPDDSGCSGPTDNDESGGGSFLPECANLMDDDDDGYIDFGDDTDCDSPANDDESGSANGVAECANGRDDDNDNFADGDDRDCWTDSFPDGTYDPTADEGGYSGSYLPACSNGLDDDGDDFADFPADPSCSDPFDSYEGGGECLDEGVYASSSSEIHGIPEMVETLRALGVIGQPQLGDGSSPPSARDSEKEAMP